jgi:hypothetical protein
MEGPNITGLQLAAYVFAVLLGLAAGALFSPKLRAFRKLLFLALPFIVAWCR